MARHLYIAGKDRWHDCERGSLEIEAALTYELDTCSFRVRGAQPTKYEEVIIEDDVGGRLFGGVITKVAFAWVSTDRKIKVWQVDCDDYTTILDRYLVVENYENVGADAIFRDIANKYCPGFTVKGVQSGAPTIETTGSEFGYKYPSECFKWLCEYINWQWYVDYYRNIHFFSLENLTTPAPMKLIPGGKFRFGTHSIDIQGMRNRVYVRGGKTISDLYAHSVKADGVTRAWVLPHKPHELSMSIAEIPVDSIGIENVHKEEDFPYLMSFQEKYVRCSSQTTTPIAGATIVFTYRYDIDVITMAEDTDSQHTIAKIQGGDGVYEHVIVDTSLTTIEAAEAAGMADLRDNANPKVTGGFETEVPGWKPGQIVDIDLQDRGIVGEYLVRRVTITPTLEKWTYHIEYGGRLKGIADFLKALVSAQQKKDIGDTTIISKFKRVIFPCVVDGGMNESKRTPPWHCGEDDAVCGFVECAGEVF